MRTTGPPGEHGRPVAGRSHHIADVADHFLGASRGGAPFVFVAGPAADPEFSRELARAWASTVGAHAQYVDGAPAPATDPRADGIGGAYRRETALEPQAPEQAVFWRLGPLSADRLDDLEAVGRVPGGRLPGADRRRLLVWCLDAAEARRWRPLLGLGRLAGILQPARTVLAVEADAWSSDAARLVRLRGGIAAGRDLELLVVPGARRPGARAAALTGLPDLLLLPAT